MRESATLEFKQEISKTYLKTVSAFANYGTGTIVFGVDDNGANLGIDNPEDACLRIENAINDSLKPVPHFSLEIDEKNRVVTLTVQEGEDKPYLYNGKAYKRADTSTVEVSNIERNRLILAGENTSFDALKSKFQNLTFELFQDTLSHELGLERLDRNALISLELMNSANEFNNAAELLADFNHFPGVDIARFGESINIIRSRHTFEHVSILAQMEQTLSLFDEYYAFEEIVGTKRIKKSLIPHEAFREALANALVHRCWDVNAHIKISMFDDRIEIMSPGSLPDGITEEEYLAGGPSIARNPILANVFFRLGYIERFGTGIPRILKEYANYTVSPTFSVRPASITVTLPVENSIRITPDEANALGVLRKGLIMTRAEISEASGLSKDKTISILNGLIAKGIIEKIGAGRSVKYTRN